MTATNQKARELPAIHLAPLVMPSSPLGPAASAGEKTFLPRMSALMPARMMRRILTRNVLLMKKLTASDVKSIRPESAFTVKPIQAMGNKSLVPSSGNTGLYPSTRRLIRPSVPSSSAIPSVCKVSSNG